MVSIEVSHLVRIFLDLLSPDDKFLVPKSAEKHKSTEKKRAKTDKKSRE